MADTFADYLAALRAQLGAAVPIEVSDALLHGAVAALTTIRDAPVSVVDATNAVTSLTASVDLATLSLDATNITTATTALLEIAVSAASATIATEATVTALSDVNLSLVTATTTLSDVALSCASAEAALVDVAISCASAVTFLSDILLSGAPVTGTLLNAVEITGAGTALDVSAKNPGDHAWNFVFTGAPDTFDADLEGALNDVEAEYAVLDSYTGTTDATRWVSGKPVRFVRVNVTALEGGTTPTVTVQYVGDR